MGGAERVTRTLAREAARSGQFDGVDVFVLCWSRSGTLDTLESENGIRLHYTGAASERGGIAPLFNFLRRGNWRLVFSSSTHLNAFASLMRRLLLLRTERLVSRESTVMFDRDLGWRGPLLRALYMFYGAQDLVVCQTDRMLASLSAATRGRLDGLLTTVPNPIDYDRIKQGNLELQLPVIAKIPSDRKRIVWCGRLSPVKAPLRAIDVLRCLHQRGQTNAHLVIIGDGPLHSEMVARISDVGLEAFVTFTGYQSNPFAAMAGAKAGLVTSDVEGFPNVILEMLAAGIPAIVTTDCAGGLVDIAGVKVVPVACSDDLAAKLQGILRSGAERGMALPTQFTPQYFFERIMQP